MDEISKLYENWPGQEEREKEIIHDFCEKYDIINYKINGDLSVDVNNHVLLNQAKIFSLKVERKIKLDNIPIKFNRIEGAFICSFNNLKSLKNSPIYIGRGFGCTDNKLTTLIYGPKTVKGGNYLCNNNDLRDVYGFPENFYGKLEIQNNPIWEILYIIPNEKIISFIKIINEYTVIRNQKEIIESRLLDALYEIGMKDKPHRFLDYKLI